MRAIPDREAFDFESVENGLHQVRLTAKRWQVFQVADSNRFFRDHRADDQWNVFTWFAGILQQRSLSRTGGMYFRDARI